MLLIYSKYGIYLASPALPFLLDVCGRDAHVSGYRGCEEPLLDIWAAGFRKLLKASAFQLSFTQRPPWSH